jgi:glutaredoxin
LFKFYKQKYDIKLRENHLTGRDDVFPLVFVGNTHLTGESEIESKLVPSINKSKTLPMKITNIAVNLYNGLTHTGQDKIQTSEENAIVYFSVPGCEDCGKVDEYLKTIDKEKLKDSSYKLIEYSIDSSRNLNLLKQYSQLYGVEGDETAVPVIFVGNKYLVGYEQISKYLEDILNLQEKVNTKVIKVGAND